MTTRTSCRTQRDWVSFGTLERRGKVSLSSPSFQLFKPINPRRLSLMKSLFSMSTDPSPSFFLLKSFHQKCARAISLPVLTLDAYAHSSGEVMVLMTACFLLCSLTSSLSSDCTMRFFLERYDVV